MRVDLGVKVNVACCNGDWEIDTRLLVLACFNLEVVNAGVHDRNRRCGKCNRCRTVTDRDGRGFH